MFILFTFHTYLLINNKTTLESSTCGAPNPYNLGPVRNIQVVLGKNLWTKLLPIDNAMKGNGVDWFDNIRVGSDIDTRGENTILQQNYVDDTH